MHIIHGELRKAPYVKTGMGQDGQTTMFIIELSEMIKDRQTGEKLYTNYSAAIFAKSPAQIDYYNTSLVEGNYVVVNCEKLKVKVSDCKQYIKLEMENARLEGAKYIEASQGGFQQAPAQQQYQQPPQNQGGFNQQPPQQSSQWPHGNQGQQQTPNFPQDNTPPF
ncbi:MAG: hypothetical protein GY787_06730 [Alteromonadales bacterium]|nr:hypothetical protein [Alteromonadales bacterium]